MRKATGESWSERKLERPRDIPYRLYGLIGVFCLVIAVRFLLPGKQREFQASHNELALGAKSPVSSIYIPYTDTDANLAVKGKSGVLDLRNQAVHKWKELLTRPYEPSEYVFSEIDENLPWPSLQSYFFGGTEAPTMEGAPADLPGIVNPFMLLIPDFIAYASPGEHLQWDKRKLSPPQIAAKTFPLYPKPDGTWWYPKEKRIEAYYNLTRWASEVSAWTVKPIEARQTTFGISGYNAVDFDMKALFLSLNESQNVTNPQQPEGPMGIGDRFDVWKERCPGFGDCNFRGLSLLPYGVLHITALPARAVFHLWQSPPASKDVAPDLRYTINLK